MLKTNSKQVKEKIRAYIMEGFTDYEGKEAEGRTFEEVAQYLAECFACEKISYKPEERAKKFYNQHISLQELFSEWCAGLPSVLDTCYHYNRSAVKDLGDILEQTEEERHKYTEDQAEKLLDYLIFKELSKALYNII